MMSRQTIPVTLVFFIAFADFCLATSVYFPKFGTPIVADDRLVFSGPGLRSGRLICIGKQDGKKLWNITVATNVLAPWFVLGNRLVVTVGGEIHRCELATGHLTSLYRSGYDECSLLEQGQGFILVSGRRNGIEHLSYIDSTNWRSIWETRQASRPSAQVKEVLLCDMTLQDRVSLAEREFAGISRKDGKVLWRHPLPRNIWHTRAVATSNYFVVALGSTLHCVRAADGAIVKTVRLNDDDFISPRLAVHHGQVLAWTEKDRDRGVSSRIVYSFDLPEFNKKEATEQDWYSAESYANEDVLFSVAIGHVDADLISARKKLWQEGQWNWNGIHDGYIYFSEMNPIKNHTSINRVHVKTGGRTRLYEAPLPYDLK